MVEGDNGLDAAAAQGPHDRAIVVDGAVVPLAFGRFHPAPLDRKSMGRVSERLEEIEIMLEKLVVTAGLTGAVGETSGLLVLPPVVPHVAALDLVAGGCGAPEEVAGKLERDGAARAGGGIRCHRSSSACSEPANPAAC
jgi:hypothetical protein